TACAVALRPSGSRTLTRSVVPWGRQPVTRGCTRDARSSLPSSTELGTRAMVGVAATSTDRDGLTAGGEVQATASAAISRPARLITPVSRNFAGSECEELLCPQR